jgi:hypothetical protein
MKNTVQAHRKGGTTKPAPQSQSKPAKKAVAPAPDKTLTPADIARRALDALGLLEETGNAACTLLVLSAEHARIESQSYAGWEKLDYPGFKAGIMSLAHFAIVDFELTFNDTAKGMKVIAEKIRSIKTPLKTNGGNLSYTPVGAYYSQKLNGLDSSVAAIRHLISSIGCICDARVCVEHQIAHEIAFTMGDRLITGLDALNKAQHDLHTVFLQEVGA